MKTYKTDITVFPENSTQIFKETCATIEEQFRDFVKQKLLIDVDGSCVQVFKKGSQEIVIYNDYDVGAVFIKSDINLPIKDYWKTHERLNASK